MPTRCELERPRASLQALNVVGVEREETYRFNNVQRAATATIAAYPRLAIEDSVEEPGQGADGENAENDAEADPKAFTALAFLEGDRFGSGRAGGRPHAASRGGPDNCRGHLRGVRILNVVAIKEHFNRPHRDKIFGAKAVGLNLNVVQARSVRRLKIGEREPSPIAPDNAMPAGYGWIIEVDHVFGGASDDHLVAINLEFGALETPRCNR